METADVKTPSHEAGKNSADTGARTMAKPLPPLDARQLLTDEPQIALKYFQCARRKGGHKRVFLKKIEFLPLRLT